MKRKLLVVLTAALLVILASCTSADELINDAVSAFGSVLDVQHASVEDGDNYRLEAPDGSARIMWSPEDITLWFDIAPFNEAGLDFSKLAPEIYNGGETAFFVHTGTFNMLRLNPQETAIEQFAESLKYKRNNLSYHETTERFNLDFGAAMFEWAKDVSSSGSDIVFILDPVPLIAAGLDPDNVEGWTYAEVSAMVAAKEENVYRLIKPFDLK
ncbi:hypothetical protein FACS1894219_06650 [Clostridia bacterium]|nr:hypothetical protein FACS1894219_06650 [Clostridia bacterium]